MCVGSPLAAAHAHARAHTHAHAYGACCVSSTPPAGHWLPCISSGTLFSFPLGPARTCILLHPSRLGDCLCTQYSGGPHAACGRCANCLRFRVM